MSHSASFIRAARRGRQPLADVVQRHLWIPTLLSMLVLFVGSFPANVQAQSMAAPFNTEEEVEGNLDDVDFSNWTKTQWKDLRKVQLSSLLSPDTEVQQEAIRNIIYLMGYHREKVNFDRASHAMLDIYIFDRNERHRIVALAGLHAIGNRDVMAHLAQRVTLESSPRVRRLTMAALADYYGLRDYEAVPDTSLTGDQLARVKGE